ncbi:MAG: PilZ domain-containing protein [Pseudomonadota bacterium]
MTEEGTPPTLEEPAEEKRKSLRVPLRVVRIGAAAAKGAEVFFGYANNISTSGLFILTPNPRERGSKFRLSFVLPNATRDRITCEAEVVWVQNYSGKGSTPGMGLRFTDLSPAGLQTIDRFVSEMG